MWRCGQGRGPGSGLQPCFALSLGRLGYLGMGVGEGLLQLPDFVFKGHTQAELALVVLEQARGAGVRKRRAGE